jgi:4-amino-4-deoxy-L-arabinose transferase-like glycosyltransferase
VTNRRFEVAWAAAALVYLGAFAWRGSQVPSDDIIWASIARHMIDSGNYLDIVIQGDVGHQRPPLGVWVIAAATALAGRGELGLRLAGILAGWATLLALPRIGARLWGGAEGRLAGVALAASALFYFNARRPMGEVPLVAFGALTIATYLAPQRSAARWAAVGALAGCAHLTKQVVGLLPTALVLAHWLAFHRRDERARGPLLAAAAFAAVWAPWHVIQTVRYGSAFWSEYLGFNVLARARVSWFAPPDPLFYPRTLAELDVAFAVLAAAALVYVSVRLARALYARPEPRSPEAAVVRADLFAVVWLAAAYLPFQLAATKLPHYLLSALPPAALLVGRLLAALPRRVPLQTALLGALSFALGLANIAPHLANPDYSPDEKAFGLWLRAEARPAARVTALDAYAQALFHYAERPLDFSATTERAVSLIRQSEALARSGAVHFVPPDRFAAELAANPAGVYVVAPRLVADAVRARLAVDAPSAVVSITQGTNYDLVVINAATR